VGLAQHLLSRDPWGTVWVETEAGSQADEPLQRSTNNEAQHQSC